jgi:hypothetical protein
MESYYLRDKPQAYPDNFLPPHTDQFYATDIPMYYDDKHRFNIDRALSKEDILKQSSSYPLLDTSKVSFDDLDWDRAAQYSGATDQSTLNLKYIDPQNITKDDLSSVSHETIHRTFDDKHGITAASNLLKGSIEPYGKYFGTDNPGPKRATDYNPDFNLPEDRLKNEHLLIDAIQNMDYPEFDASKLDDNLYQGYWNRYHNALLDEVSDSDESKYYGNRLKDHQYYAPEWAEGFNAPGEVRRGYLGLRDLFDRSARKYKNIMKNYANRRRAGPRVCNPTSPRRTSWRCWNCRTNSGTR